MNTRAISTTTAISSCDVCGRTLLRGERAQVYVGGGARHSVCELCTSRALHGGWIREGQLPEYDETTARPDRRRSLFGRLRTRRDMPMRAEEEYEPSFDDEPVAPAPAPRTPPPSRAPMPRTPRPVSETREPRHVRAVPTSVEHKISTAVELFNGSEHPKTVAGIARSLGLPEASVLPVAGAPSRVNVVVAWELCWYRYEVDLSDDEPAVQKAGQGYELSELAPEERCANAVAADSGHLSV
ncbi:MAG TPA: hypothetical protein VFN55_10240 [Solirubrobacteraceae bacterium]|nr:hypothetical protein [Solirubrobacteraceae bacterium]